MAINHYRVSPKFWPKARARGWSDQQITLGLYLLTCKHRNLEGLYVLPKPYIAADLAWPAKRVEETLATLIDAGFAQYDDDAQVVLIPKALKHQSPSTKNQITGAIAQLKAIPRTCLWDAFRMACQSHCPALADAIDIEWPAHADGASHAHAGSPAHATSSSSISRTNPPQPPAERGEQEQTGSAQGQEPPPNSRAHGTNPRAVAQAAQAAAAENSATLAVASLGAPTDEHVEAWHRVRQQMQVAVPESSWAIHLSTVQLVGVDGEVLVADSPDDTRTWVTNRFLKVIEQCAGAQGVALRLASDDEHRGLAAGSAVAA